ncbi:polysaccharide deacetylase family protein [Streptomyces sp. NPDC086989]|uniref:polysaccharide deacetylase family protein n=1 Tax=Streptomyces sp. NPDC086989 TaxID=3365764 RepID=UPI0038189205
MFRNDTADHEIGLHTFTHTDLATATPRRTRLEPAASRAVLVGATGSTTTLLRPPYSSTPDAVSNRDWRSPAARRQRRPIPHRRGPGRLIDTQPGAESG